MMPPAVKAKPKSSPATQPMISLRAMAMLSAIARTSAFPANEPGNIRDKGLQKTPTWPNPIVGRDEQARPLSVSGSFRGFRKMVSSGRVADRDFDLDR
jgi:hypothetical protein